MQVYIKESTSGRSALIGQNAVLEGVFKNSCFKCATGRIVDRCTNTYIAELPQDTIFYVYSNKGKKLVCLYGLKALSQKHLKGKTVVVFEDQVTWLDTIAENAFQTAVNGPMWCLHS